MGRFFCMIRALSVDSSPRECGLSADKVDLPLTKITFDRNFIYFFFGLFVTPCVNIAVIVCCHCSYRNYVRCIIDYFKTFILGGNMLNKVKSHLFVGKTILSYLVSFIFILGAVSVGAVRKAPYLIYREYEDESKVQHKEMQILCQLEPEAAYNCTIRWRLDGDFYNEPVEMDSFGDDFQYFYTIDNLTPGELYYYEVVANGEVFSGSFRASPADNATATKFFVYGDTRLDADDSIPDDHNHVAAAIIANYDEEPTWQTCVISVGDLVNRNNYENNLDGYFFNSDYININKMLREMPYQSCIGNHEYDADGGAAFRKYFPYVYEEEDDTHYWSFDYGPALFVYLDQYQQTDYIPGNTQYDWIESTLANSDKKWKFIVLHHPCWSAGGHSNYTQAQALQDLFIDNGVSFVFGGHNHYYARAVVDGIQHITTGGGGAPLETPDENCDNVEVVAESHHYCRVEIVDDILTFEAVDIDGTPIDTVTLEKKDLTSGYNWESFPRLVRDESINDSVDVVPILKRMVPANFGYLHFDAKGINDLEYDYPNWYPAAYNIQSTWLYKIKAASDEERTLILGGTRMADNYQLAEPLAAYEYHWLGYWLLGIQDVNLAFGDLWDKVVAVKAENWAWMDMSNPRNPFEPEPRPSMKIRPLEYGKGYMVKFKEVIENFHWTNSNIIEVPYRKPKPEYFEYEEKADYEVIDILDIPADVVEIGVFEDARCVGAVAVRDSCEQILVYSNRMNRDETIFTFQIVYGRSGSVPFNNYTVYNAEVGAYVKDKITAGRQQYSAIRFESGEPSDPPQVMRLLGNFPNPFNPTTTISFNLTTNLHEKARIEIFNIKGQKVKTLANLQITNSPNQQVIWDAEKFASGVYLYKLVVDNKTVDTKKMILLK